MVNHRGVMRIVEASIAILIIIGVLLAVGLDRGGEEVDDPAEMIAGILDEIAKDSGLRERILDYDAGANTVDESGIVFSAANQAILDEVKDFVDVRSKPGLEVSVNVCDAGVHCPLPDENYPDAEEIYVDERIISTSVGSGSAFEPKKVKVFLWRGERSE